MGSYETSGSHTLEAGPASLVTVTPSPPLTLSPSSLAYLELASFGISGMHHLFDFNSSNLLLPVVFQVLEGWARIRKESLHCGFEVG